ncbi:hypothetical protein SAMN05216262_11441 [Colwellia chukchiensis]|uniref:Copper(I)-binding protein n=1 Tax=Colwellia chukchiensis TaxID=641665 RepID=A0A1H7RC22_9GAMM|nr:copper chaperone PCu(A)C [Colwellia chukchiensis]SEL57682.1 hypothetical protein SAMN05216262_11441 [Colwellia chukchiensis]
MRIIFLLVLIVSNLLFCAANASQNAQIKVENSYARESIPGTSISSAYMTIKNLSNSNRRLVAATSDVSDRIEIHQHTMVDGLMRMRQLRFVDILANDSVQFQPSGLHLMIFDLKQSLTAQQQMTITLHFDDQTSVDVTYSIKGLKQKKHHHH